MATTTSKVRDRSAAGPHRPTIWQPQVLLVVTATWIAIGAYTDGRAHESNPGLETFFTPWHAVLYSGYLASAILLGWGVLASKRRTGSWLAGLPDGWALSLAGAAVFAAGGVGDMLWHVIFGIEVGIEALLSPTHLLLAIGGALIATGPLRAAWRGSSTVLPWTGAASAALLLANISFMTVYSQPFGYVYAAVRPPQEAVSGLAGQIIGVTSVLWQTALVVGLLLLLTRRFRVPVGVPSLLLVSHALLLGFMESFTWLVPAAVVGGLAIELLLSRLSSGSPRDVRLLGLTAPVAMYAPYFLAVTLAAGLAWSEDLWAGSIVAATLTGLLASYLIAPPPWPQLDRVRPTSD
jgi:hypothetical protein